MILIHSTSADFYTAELNNLAASSKRGDVILRCILSALSTKNNQPSSSDFGIWVFFNQNEHGPQQSLLLDDGTGLPNEIRNEIQLCSFLQPIIVSRSAKEEDTEFEITKENIKIYKKTISHAIKLLRNQKYLFMMLDEHGIQHSLEEIAQLSRQNEKIVFILGDQVGVSTEIIRFLSEFKIEPIKISLGPVSYLTSQCISILRLLFR